MMIERKKGRGVGRFCGVVTFVLALAGSAGDALGAQQYSLTGNPSVWVPAGEVEVVRGSGSEVVATVERLGRDASQLSIETGVVRGRSSLRVIVPGDRIVWDRGDGSRYQAQLRVREDGTFGDDVGRRVTVSGAGDGVRAHARIRIEVPVGKNLSVHVGAGGIVADGITGDLDLRTRAGPVQANRITGRVLADTGSGTVRLGDIEGDVSADTGSGAITLSDIRGGRVELDTGSGGITGERLAATELTADTGSGQVDLTGIRADQVEVDTGSGGVRLAFDDVVRRLVVDTGSGGVDVQFASRVDAEIEIDTGAGAISVDFPVEVRSMERTHFLGRAGTGAGEIEIDTGSGGVRLRIAGSGGAGPG